MTFFRTYLYSSVASLILLLGMPLFANAATIGFDPATNIVSEGDIFTISAVTNTEGVAINNADAVINFPKDLIEVVSIGKSSSVFSLWVEDPTFSNTAGSITFDGGKPTPGYAGQKGNIISIVFRAKKAGTATVLYSSASVRANDGVGTNVLSIKSSAVIQITGAKQPEIIAVPVRSDTLPSVPLVISSTHPKSDLWYSGSSASFSWQIPNGVTSIQTLLGSSPKSNPTLTYDSTVTSKTINNLKDGVLYFHLRYMNSVGWGPVAHYKIQIDSTPPDSFAPRVRTENLISYIELYAKDATSGIDYFSVAIDNENPIKIRLNELVNDEYVLPVQYGGERKLTAIAYDKAGNHTDPYSLSFVAPQIPAPSVAVSPERITKGESAKVVGNSKYRNTDAIIFVQEGNGEIVEYATKTSEDGSFGVTLDRFDGSGKVHIWAQLVFSGQVKSPLSEKVLLLVESTEASRFGLSVVYSLLWIMLIVILIFAILIATYLGWHKYMGLKKKMTDDVEKVIEEIHDTFKLYKEELGERLEELEAISEDRALNKKEEKIFKKLQDNIDTIDEFIEKKLKKIK